MDEMNTTAIAFVVLIALGVAAFVFKKPQILNAIRGTSKTNLPVVSNAARAANKVFNSADDFLRYTDDVFYGSKESLKEVAKSPTAIPIATGAGSTLGYIIHKNGKEIIVLDQKEKEWIPKQAHQISSEQLSKFKPIPKEVLERARNTTISRE
ncbi:MAG: hypothetical protein AAGG68_24570 [Bacteroidota bacterium]